MLGPGHPALPKSNQFPSSTSAYPQRCAGHAQQVYRTLALLEVQWGFKGSGWDGAQPSLSHAIRVKTAEYWLKLGDADQALKELERLPRTTWTQPWVVRIRVAAVGTLRQRDEVLA